jgi:hypothetical protein
MKHRSKIVLSLVAFAGCLATTGWLLVGPPSLQELFEGLVRQYASGNPPSYEDALKVATRTRDSASPDEVTTALPQIMAAFQNRDIRVQQAAALVIWGIGMRPDGATLLRGQFQALAQLFRSPDEHMQMVPVYLVSELRSPPPSEVVPLLLEFLELPKRDTKAQTGAVGVLGRIAPHDPQVIAAIKVFVAKQREPEARILTLNALRGLQTNDEQLIAEVVDTLKDPDKAVRFVALQVIPTMGHSALLEAEPTMRKIVANPDESAENRALAEQDLRNLTGQPDKR